MVVDGGERNGWNATPHRGVNVFRGIVSVGSNDRLIDHLTLVRDRQTVLRRQLTELFMSEAHDYRMRIIIKQPGALSTDIIRPILNTVPTTPRSRTLWPRGPVVPQNTLAQSVRRVRRTMGSSVEGLSRQAQP